MLICPRGRGIRSRFPDSKKYPQNRRETCALRLARAIRRTNRAGADTRPRPRGLRAKQGPPLPAGQGDEMTATDPRPEPPPPQDDRPGYRCAGRASMTKHDIS